jgi:hypothetical protein
MIPLLCDRCNLNYCLKHRHAADHDCSPTSDKPLGKAAMAAMTRSQSNTNHTNPKSQTASQSRNSWSSNISNATSAVSNGIGRFLGHGQGATNVQGNMV